MTAALPRIEALPTDVSTRDTVPRGEGLVDELNAVLAASEQEEDRRPMGINRFGQWCTHGIGGWRPHSSYMQAWVAAHGEDLA